MKTLLLILLCPLLFAMPDVCRAEAVGGSKLPSSTQPGAATSGLLRIGINATTLETLDPHMAASFNDRMVADMIFNGLLRYKPGDAPNFEPDLAVEIPEPFIVDNRQIWTFKLRRGVMFHSGPDNSRYELTADDVVYSFRKAADPKRSAYAGEYEGMTVEKVDDHTCNIILDPPLSPNLFFSKVADYAGGFIVSRRALQALEGGIYRDHPVGTGPFHFAAMASMQRLRLKAHGEYFRGRPQLEEIHIRFLPEPEEIYAAFSRGEIDLMRDVTVHGQKRVLPPGSLVDTFGVPEVALVHLNTSVPPLDDLRVRQAIAYALDRKTFLSRFPRESVESVFAPIPHRFLPGGLSPHAVSALGLDYPTDRAKSRALLTAAGYPDGFSLDVVATELDHVLVNYRTLQAQLQKVGIRINLKIVDHATMHRMVRQNLSPIVIYEAWRPNTDVFLSRFFHSDSIVVTGKTPDTNFSHYHGIDDMILLARKEMNPIKQVRLWEYAQVKLLEDMVVFPLHYRYRTYLRHDYVDYGHLLNASMALYPQVTEKTRILQ